MYNRYIPQSDGTFQKSRIPEPNVPKPDKRPESPPPPPPKQPHASVHRPPPNHIGMSAFLRQLLPKGFDTGDLFVVLLLLLMAGDCPEDRNNAILTIALYFLM